MRPTAESFENHISDLTTMPENMQVSKNLRSPYFNEDRMTITAMLIAIAPSRGKLYV